MNLKVHVHIVLPSSPQNVRGEVVWVNGFYIQMLNSLETKK